MTLDLDKSTWQRVAFGDVVRNVNLTVKDPEDEGIDRVIAMEHLDPGELRISRWGTIEDGTTFTRRVRPGQTLFGKRRAYQRKAAFADFDAITSGDILTFEAIKGQLLPEFLPFIVQSDGFYHHALGTSAGSLSPRTNWRDLATFEFDLPPLPEQQRLADLLWAVERHQHQLSHAAHCALGTLKELRTSFMTSTGNEVHATRAFDITLGRQRAPQHHDGDHVLPYIRSANITPAGIDTSDVNQMNFTPEEQAVYTLQHGDVLVSEGSASGSAVGMPAVWKADLPGTICFQKTLLRYRAIPSVTLPGFVEQWSQWAYESGAFLKASLGTSIYHIGLRGAVSMRVVLPGIEDQKLFLQTVQNCAASTDALLDEANAIGTVYDRLSEELFGGAH